MKTITSNQNNVSLYLFEDSETIVVTQTEITVGNPPRFIIGDLNSTNSTLFENVSNPEDWQGWKYLYAAADGWVLNPDWNPPESPSAT